MMSHRLPRWARASKSSGIPPLARLPTLGLPMEICHARA
jgi:hypothetical protein